MTETPDTPEVPAKPKSRFKAPPRNRTKAGRFDVLLRKLKQEIPSFKSCKRCGQCCGPLKCDVLELDKIRKYLNHEDMWGFLDLQYKIHKALEEKTKVKSCYFFAMGKDKVASCVIYPVRPIVCRMQGLKAELPCPNSPCAPIKMTERMKQYYAEVREHGIVLNDEIEKMLLNRVKVVSSSGKAQETQELADNPK